MYRNRVIHSTGTILVFVSFSFKHLVCYCPVENGVQQCKKYESCIYIITCTSQSMFRCLTGYIFNKIRG